METSREIILSALRKAPGISSHLSESPVEIDKRIEESLASIIPVGAEALTEQFKKELESVSGQFLAPASLREAASTILEITRSGGMAIAGDELCWELADEIRKIDRDIQLVNAVKLEGTDRKSRLSSIPKALVEPSYAIADIGALVFPYDRSRTSLPHFLSDCVIAVVTRRQIVANQFELFEKISLEEARNMVFIAGPSRTADIEKVLILGAHGPRRLIVMMFE